MMTFCYGAKVFQSHSSVPTAYGAFSVGCDYTKGETAIREGKAQEKPKEEKARKAVDTIGVACFFVTGQIF